MILKAGVRFFRAVCVVTGLAVVLASPARVSAQAANNPEQEREIVDRTTDSLIGKVAEETDEAIGEAEVAIKNEARRDLRMIQSSPTPQAIAVPEPATTAVPSESQTLEELDELEQEAEDLPPGDD